jgi:histone acetyltransferase
LTTPSQPTPQPPKVEVIPIEPTSEFLKQAEKVLSELRNHACAAPFMLPVDETYAPLYNTIVKTPMDLSTVDKKMRRGYYRNEVESMYSDIRLIFSNCYLVS